MSVYKLPLPPLEQALKACSQAYEIVFQYGTDEDYLFTQEDYAWLTLIEGYCEDAYSTPLRHLGEERKRAGDPSQTLCPHHMGTDLALPSGFWGSTED